MRRGAGFTLIELIVTLVLLSITAVSLSFFFGGTVSGYLDAASRQDTAAVARLALDRMARELRQAMPQSLRISGNCLQFLPIVAGTSYTSLNPGATTVAVLAFPDPAGVNLGAPPANTYFLAVHPAGAAELYGQVALKPIAGVAAAAGGQRSVNLGAAAAFPQSSPGRRAYVLGRPVSFCREAGGLLRRYVSDLSPVQAVPPGLTGGALLASRLVDTAAPPAFTYQLGNTRANALVTLNLSLSQRGETLALNHEVRLRNVP